MATREDPEEPAKHRLVAVFAVIGFTIPIAAYFWLINNFGVNVPLADQLTDVKIIGESFSGHLSLSDLWAPHNENRLFFPHLIVLLLARTTRFNVVAEEYVGAVLLVMSIGLLIFTHRRRTGRTEWVYYCPVAILMLSFVQYQNALWGFQLAWYLVLFAVAVTFFLLDVPTFTWPLLALSIASGVIASFSSLQGLIIWPVGLLFLYYRRRTRVFTLVWIVAAAATTAVYFYHSNLGPPGYATHHVTESLEFYLAVIGDVVGAGFVSANPLGVAVLGFGFVILAASLWALVTFCIGRTRSESDLLGVALICFGLLFAALVTEGRTLEGFSAASQSRYRTFDLLVVVGLYLMLLDRLSSSATTASLPPSGVFRAEGDRAEIQRNTSVARSDRRSFAVFAAVVIAVVGLQVGVGIPTGISGAESDHASEIVGARLLVNASKYPDICQGVRFYSATFRKQMAAVLEVHHLSLFATADAAKYRAEGLVTFPLPTMRVVVLAEKPGTPVLRGVQNLDAIASDNCGITKVDIEATGNGLDHAVISSAVLSPYGWIAIWRTTTLADGGYTLQGLALLPVGREVLSPGIRVVVKNQ